MIVCRVLLLGAIAMLSIGCKSSPDTSLPSGKLLHVKNQNKEAQSVKDERMKLKVSQVKNDLETMSFSGADNKMVRHITIKTVELQDNKGLKYVGGEVLKKDLSIYLKQLKTILGDDFEQYRANQGTRDHHTFHMTLVNPYEYRDLTVPVTVGDYFTVSLLGLGKVEQKDKATYFVVARSNDAKYFRQKLALQPKDFHVTLGFNPNDIYGVRKNKDTLIVDDMLNESLSID